MGNGKRERKGVTMLINVKFLLFRYGAFPLITIITLRKISTPSLIFSASNNAHYAKLHSWEPLKLENGD